MIDKNKTIEILTALANGIDPVSGEVFPSDSPYHQTKVVRALFNAVHMLQDTKVKKQLKDKPLNQGEPWSEQEDKNLTDAFRDGVSIKKLAEIHQRTRGAIQSRLRKHHLIDERGNNFFEQ